MTVRKIDGNHGRPSLIVNKTLINKLIRELKTGATIEIACRNAGLGLSTFHLWQSIAKAYRDEDEAFFIKLGYKPKHEEAYLDFLDKVERAKDYVIGKAYKIYQSILDHSLSQTQGELRDWVKYRELQFKVAQRVLEGRDPERNARDRVNRQLDVTSNGKTIKGFVGVSPDDWDE